MPYNIVAVVFKQRNFAAKFLPEKCILHGKRPFCFLSPFGSLAEAYDVHLRLIRKRVVNY